MTKLEKAVVAWAENRRRFMRAEPLGKASCRTSLFKKAETLQKMGLALKYKKR